MVGYFRRGCPDRSVVVDLRPRGQAFRAGSGWVKRIDLENRESFYLDCELKTECVFSSPCGGANRAPASPGNSAARFAALPGSSASRGRTFLFRDTSAPDCNAENGAARSGAPPWRVPARESLPRSGPARSGKRRCRCKDCRIPDRSRWLVCTPQWLLQCAPGNDRSSRERYAPRPWDGAPMTIDTARRRARSRLPSVPDKRPAELPMHG